MDPAGGGMPGVLVGFTQVLITPNPRGSNEHSQSLYVSDSSNQPYLKLLSMTKKWHIINSNQTLVLIIPEAFNPSANFATYKSSYQLFQLRAPSRHPNLSRRVPSYKRIWLLAQKCELMRPLPIWDTKEELFICAVGRSLLIAAVTKDITICGGGQD